jgi:O-antigen ligase
MRRRLSGCDKISVPKPSFTAVRTPCLVNFMHEDALIRKGPAVGPWAIPLVIAVVAVFVGVVVGQGGWFFVPAACLLPLLWFWPVESAMGAAVLLLPFEYVTLLGTSSDGDSSRSLMSIALLLAFCVLVAAGIVGRRFQRPSATAAWWLLFITWTAASTAWAVEPQMALKYLPSAGALFLFYLVANSFRITEKEFDRIVWLTILGGALAALFSVYGFYYGAGAAQHATRATLAAGGGYVNPNRFGSTLLVPLAFAMARSFGAQHRWARMCALALLVITSLGLLLTLSRGTILAAVVTTLVFLYRLHSLKLKSLKPKLRRSLVLAVLLLVGFAAVMPSTFFERFLESGSDRGSGRLDIWTAGMVMFMHYPIAGAGLNNFPVIYSKYAGYESHVYSNHGGADSHNVYLAISVEEGAVGLFLFLMAIRKQFQLVSRCRARIVGSPIMLVCCEAAFCGMLVICLFGNLLWDKAFWFVWVFLAFAITVQTTKISEEETLNAKRKQFDGGLFPDGRLRPWAVRVESAPR